jgi:hypothetical protein
VVVDAFTAATVLRVQHWQGVEKKATEARQKKEEEWAAGADEREIEYKKAKEVVEKYLEQEKRTGEPSAEERSAKTRRTAANKRAFEERDAEVAAAKQPAAVVKAKEMEQEAERERVLIRDFDTSHSKTLARQRLQYADDDAQTERDRLTAVRTRRQGCGVALVPFRGQHGPVPRRGPADAHMTDAEVAADDAAARLVV